MANSKNKFEEVKEKRSSNWTEAERDVLVTNVRSNYTKLFGKFSNCISHQTKEALWGTITDMVNAQCQGSKRTIANTKKQWVDLKSNAKKQAARIYQSLKITGGGEKDSDAMDQVLEKISICENWTRKIVRMIGNEAFMGIEDGVDFSSPNCNLALDYNHNPPKKSRIETAVTSDDQEMIGEAVNHANISLIPVHSQESEEFLESMVDYILTPSTDRAALPSPQKAKKPSKPLQAKVWHTKGHENEKLALSVSERMLIVQENILEEMRILNGNFGKLVDIVNQFTARK